MGLVTVLSRFLKNKNIIHIPGIIWCLSYPPVVSGTFAPVTYAGLGPVSTAGIPPCSHATRMRLAQGHWALQATYWRSTPDFLGDLSCTRLHWRWAVHVTWQTAAVHVTGAADNFYDNWVDQLAAADAAHD